MADWVEKHKPYEAVSTAELRTGTVLRRVPFPATLLAASSFGLPDNSGEPQRAELATIDLGREVVRSDKVVISPGIVMTPDCDIYLHKCNAVTVAQLISLEDYISINKPNSDLKKRINDSASRARSANPGSFEVRGLLWLPADATLKFEECLVLLENHVSLPIEYVETSPKSFAVSPESVGGPGNLWFRIKDDPLRIRLVNEFARLMLRIGLEDA